MGLNQNLKPNEDPAKRPRISASSSLLKVNSYYTIFTSSIIKQQKEPHQQQYNKVIFRKNDTMIMSSKHVLSI